MNRTKKKKYLHSHQILRRDIHIGTRTDHYDPPDADVAFVQPTQGLQKD